MKTNWQVFYRLALVLAGFALLIGITRIAAPAGTAEASVADDASLSVSNVPPADVAATTAASTNSISTENLAPISAPTPAPEVRLSKGAAEIAKLAQAGLGEDVMLAYVANVTSGFNLGSDQIVYLNDLGVSGAVVKSMIQRDAALQAASASSLAAVTPPPANPIPPFPANPAQPPPPPQVDYSLPPNPPYDTGETASAPAPDSDYFYNSLAPYGNWIFVAGAGVCWQPTVYRVNREWRPYNDRGRWLYSDCGWYWQSDYSWGWAAFHYGRWFNDAGRGWVWSPDRVWGPAWVSWRQSADYCGWAPLPPAAHFAPGIGFTVANQAVSASFEFGLQPEQYTFVPNGRLSDYSPGRYAAPSWQVRELHSRTELANHFEFQNRRVENHNIDPQKVAALARTNIRRVEIREVPGEANKPVQPERLTKSSGAMVVITPQLPAPTSHHSVTVSQAGSRAPFGPAGNSGLPRTSFNPSPSSAPAALGSVSSAGRPETYPAGSLVLSGRTDANTPRPANPAPSQNLNLSYQARQAAANATQPAQPNRVVATPNYALPSAPPPLRQEAARSSAGFNFDGNFNRPNFNERVEIQTPPAPPQTAYAATPPQNGYVIPGRFTVSQQLGAPRYNGGGASAVATDQARSEPMQPSDQARLHSDNAYAPLHQRSEPAYQPVMQQPSRQDAPSVERAAAAQHFAPPAPAQSAPQAAQSSSTSGSTSPGRR